MKIIFIAFVLITFYSCKENKQAKDKSYPSNHDPDTSIHQSVWVYKGQYVLQTVVQTEIQQTAMSNHSDFNAFLETDSYAPYNKEIVGSFAYIRDNKAIEYNKADYFMKDLRLKAARDSIAFKATLLGKMSDSAEVLNKMRFYSDSLIRTDNRALDGISTDKGIYKYEKSSKK